MGRFTSSSGYSRSYNARWEGVLKLLQRRYQQTSSEMAKAEIEQYMSDIPCDACLGKRLKPETLAVRIGSANITDVTEKSIDSAHEWFENLSLSERDAAVEKFRKYRDETLKKGKGRPKAEAGLKPFAAKKRKGGKG